MASSTTPRAMGSADPEGREHLVEGKRQVVDIEVLNVDERPWNQLRAVDQQVRAPLTTWLQIPARVGQRPDGMERNLGAEEIRRTGAAHQLGAGVDQRRHVVQVEFAGKR